MGNLFLTIDDEDNDLNLYNFGNNSAYLNIDESKDYLKINAFTITENGNFHRLYDPSGINFYSVNFEGLKIINENQTFKGLIYHKDIFKKDIFRSSQTDMYVPSSFKLIDDFIGTLNLSGPGIKFEYCINLLKDLSLGTRFGYEAVNGIKKDSAKPEITDRLISGQVALSYGILNNLYIGLSVDPYFDFEKIEEVEDDITGKAPNTYRYRGYNIYRVYAKSFTRYNKNYGVNLSFQTSYFTPDSLINLFLTYGYDFRNSYCEDGVEEKYYEGYWEGKGHSVKLATRIYPKSIDRNLTLGLQAEWNKFNSWSKHPHLPLLFNEDENTHFNYGAGFSYFIPAISVRLGFEFHKSKIDTVLNDYLGNENFSDNFSINDLRFGLEFNLSERISIRAGYNYIKDAFIYTAIYPETKLPKVNYNISSVTFGLSYLYPDFVKIDLTGSYNKKESSDLNNKLTYDGLNVNLFAKFYVF